MPEPHFMWCFQTRKLCTYTQAVRSSSKHPTNNNNSKKPKKGKEEKEKRKNTSQKQKHEICNISSHSRFSLSFCSSAKISFPSRKTSSRAAAHDTSTEAKAYVILWCALNGDLMCAVFSALLVLASSFRSFLLLCVIQRRFDGAGCHRATPFELFNSSTSWWYMDETRYTVWMCAVRTCEAKAPANVISGLYLCIQYIRWQRANGNGYIAKEYMWQNVVHKSFASFVRYSLRGTECDCHIEHYKDIHLSYARHENDSMTQGFCEPKKFRGINGKTSQPKENRE